MVWSMLKNHKKQRKLLKLTITGSIVKFQVCLFFFNEKISHAQNALTSKH